MSLAQLQQQLRAQQATAQRLNPHGAQYRAVMHEVSHTRRLIQEREQQISQLK